MTTVTDVFFDDNMHDLSRPLSLNHILVTPQLQTGFLSFITPIFLLDTDGFVV